MTDIVERLRMALRDERELIGFDVREAADEIERLRTALGYHVNELREARREIDRLRGAA